MKPMTAAQAQVVTTTTRASQGLPPTITKPAVVERIAAILDRAET